MNNKEFEKSQDELQKQNDHDANRDPITGEPGAHPVGTGIGAAAVGTIGTVVGAAGGPVGAVAGAVIGSVIGGLVGKSTAESYDPTVEDDYWRDNYSSRPYIHNDLTYNDYQPAYRMGYEGYQRYSGKGRSYNEVESDLQRDYETNHHDSRLGWDNAKYAVQDAWNRVSDQSILRHEDDYWRQNYASQPYYEQGLTYDDYQPAYRMGYEGYAHYRNAGRRFDEVEPELRQDYERSSGTSGMGWERVKYAVRDAWNRAENAFSRNHSRYNDRNF